MSAADPDIGKALGPALGRTWDTQRGDVISLLSMEPVIAYRDPVSGQGGDLVKSAGQQPSTARPSAALSVTRARGAAQPGAADRTAVRVGPGGRRTDGGSADRASSAGTIVSTSMIRNDRLK